MGLAPPPWKIQYKEEVVISPNTIGIPKAVHKATGHLIIPVRQMFVLGDLHSKHKPRPPVKERGMKSLLKSLLNPR